jgi:hypothetical protein
VNIIQALESPALFAPHFASESWWPWKAALAALFGLPMTKKQAALFRECTGRTTPPTKPFREAAFVAGRRGGKSRILALIAAYIGAFIDHGPYLAAGEVASIAVICPNRKQARTTMRYIVGLLQATPALAAMIESETAESVTLNNRCVVEVHTASFKVTRGYTFAAVLCDESAFWPTDESAQPDTEILRAVRPALMTLPYSVMVLASSPYAKRGELWRSFQKNYGNDGARTLVWRGSSLAMNPSLDAGIVEEAREEDPESASSEYDALFRDGVGAWLPREVVEAAVERGLFEIPRLPMVTHVAFCDPSGGSSDSMTLAVAHRDDNGVAVLDYIAEARAPFDPDAVTEQFAETLKSYGLREVIGDKYGGLWPAERFKAHGIEYKPAERTKSQIYLEAAPLFNARRVQLLDNARLISQLCALERRTGRIGKDAVDHPPGSHDDVANAACGAINLAGNEPDALSIWLGWRSIRGDAPAPVASVPEEIGPTQLHLTGGSRPGTAEERRMAARRAARMIHDLIEPGEAVVLMSVPRDVYLLERHGQPPICVPEGERIQVPERIARHPGLPRNGARIIDETTV